jgi:hypothetical protein
MAKRLRFSRWRRLPGVYRIGQKKPPDPNLEEQRLTLYVPWALLDRAEALARKAGVETVQEYCKQLLCQAIEAEEAHARVAELQAKRGPLEGLDAIASDPEYLAEWTALAGPRGRAAPLVTRLPNAPPPAVALPLENPIMIPNETPPPLSIVASQASAIVLRHAALGGAEDPTAFLPTLRRGEPVNAAAAQELVQALRDLEVEFRSATSLDRRLAYALHRLAFEGQVLMTDAWRGVAVDGATIDTLRIVQEAVDRVLSGEDIRYFAPGTSPEGAL